MSEGTLRQELDRLGAPDGEATVESLYQPVASATTGVWRVRVDGDWSAVLKVLNPSVDVGHPMWRAGREENHWYYWRREALALNADLVGPQAGLRTPVCLATFDRLDGSVAVWLEDLSDAEPGSHWPLNRYRDAARAVGHWQGTFVATVDLPRFGWLSHDWLRAYVTRRESAMTRFRDSRHLDDDVKTAATSLWANRERLLAFLDALPRTVCHFDLHPKNLFRAGDETVLIDWAFVGIGALGEDPATLIPDTVLDFHLKPDRLDDLAEEVVAGYAAGLADAGFNVEREILTRWIDIAMLVRYTWIFGALDDHLAGDAPLLNGLPRDLAVPYWRGAVTWMAHRASSALQAIGS